MKQYGTDQVFKMVDGEWTSNPEMGEFSAEKAARSLIEDAARDFDISDASRYHKEIDGEMIFCTLNDWIIYVISSELAHPRYRDDSYILALKRERIRFIRSEFEVFERYGEL